MLSVSNNTIYKFLSGNLQKNIKLVCGTTTIGNENIVSESFELTQSLCDGEADYTGCVSTTFTIELMDVGSYIDYLRNQPIKVYIESPTNEFESILVFTGYVYDIESNLISKQVKLQCHDVFAYDLAKRPVGVTIAQEFDTSSVLSTSDLIRIACGTNQVIGQSNLVNSNISIYKKDHKSDDDLYTSTFPEDLKAIELLKFICQVNGVFGVVNNKGQIEFRKINYNGGKYNGTYPPDSDIPGTLNDYLFVPYSDIESSVETKEETQIKEIQISETETNEWFNYRVSTTASGIEYEENYSLIGQLPNGDNVFTCTSISEGGISQWSPGNTDLPGNGAIQITYLGDCQVGDTFTIKKTDYKRHVHINNGSVVENAQYPPITLKVNSNPMLYKKTYSEKCTIGQKLYGNISNPAYCKHKVTTLGFPFIEVGDFVNVRVRNIYGVTGQFDQSQYLVKQCLVLNRTLKGIQFMEDVYSADIYDQLSAPDKPTHYINSTSGTSGSGNSDDLSDNYTDAGDGEDSPNGSYDSESVDDKLQDVWDIQPVTELPDEFAEKTVYFLRYE